MSAPRKRSDARKAKKSYTEAFISASIWICWHECHQLIIRATLGPEKYEMI